MIHRACCGLLILVGAALGGCATTTHVKSAPVAQRLQMDPQALDALMFAYADRYVLLVSAATDSIQAKTTDLQRKHLAQRLKAESASSVYDMVTSGDPYGELLNLTVAVTLQSEVYIDEDQAEATFGKELAPELNRALRQARLDIWEIAGKALTPQQLDHLDLLILEFRRKNPTLPNVINVRFSDFVESTGDSTQDASWGGLFDEIAEARKSVDEARHLAEQAFYYMKREPTLISWQAETHADEMLAKPELAQFLGDVHRFGTTAEGLPGTISNERKALFAAFDERQEMLRGTLELAKGTLGQANQLATSTTETMTELRKSAVELRTLLASIDAFVDKVKGPAATQPAGGAGGSGAVVTATDPRGGSGEGSGATSQPAGHPFDVREYTTGLQELAAASKELNGVLQSSQSLLASPAWSERLKEIQKTADDRVKLASTSSERLVRDVFFRVYLSLGGLFVVLVAYRIVSLVLTRRYLPGMRRQVAQMDDAGER